MPNAHDIIILAHDTSNGNLTLSPGGDDVEAGILTTVNWSIKDPEVDLFRIERKASYPNIFVLSPPSSYSQSVSVLVGPFAARKVYKYSIWWKLKGSSTEYKYDPKISVMPSTVNFTKLLIVGIALGLLGLFSLKFTRGKMTRK